MAAEFYSAPNVRAMAIGIIEEHHSHLAEADIGYYFRSGTWTRSKRTVYGTAQKPGGLLKAVTGHDFIITINSDMWLFLQPETQEALLDHELQHCCRGEDDDDGNPVWYIQGHDFEDFAAIVRRHGLYTDELAKIPEATQKIPADQDTGVGGGEVMKGVRLNVFQKVA